MVYEVHERISYRRHRLAAAAAATVALREEYGLSWQDNGLGLTCRRWRPDGCEMVALGIDAAIRACRAATLYADGYETTGHLEAARWRCRRVCDDATMHSHKGTCGRWAASLGAMVCHPSAGGAVMRVATELFRHPTVNPARALRCVYGPLWAEGPYLARLGAWMDYNGRLAVRQASDIYRGNGDDRQAAEAYLVLADTLEEAGCTDAVVLGHLCDDEVHAVGCWVIDGLLGRKL